MDTWFRRKALSLGSGQDTASSLNRRQRTELRLAWLLGLLAFSVYLLTLCPSVYPGDSAQAMAAVLGLVPAAAAHPVWQLACRAVAHLPLFELPFRLNLFSALCGAMAVATLFKLTSRLLYEFGHVDSSTYSMLFYTYSREDAADQGAERAKEGGAAEDTDYRAAILGGLVTALAFAFGAPFWSAAVSLHYQTFDLLLLFGTANALANYIFKGNIIYCVLTVFLLGLGLLENAVFVLSAPVVLFLVFREAGRLGHLSEAFTFLFLVSGLLGFGCGCGALLTVASDGHAFDFQRILGLFVWIVHTFKSETLEGLPHLGWLLVLLETLLPLLAVFWGAPKFFRSYEPLERWLWCLLNALFTLVAIACLLGLPQTPWFLARQTFHLPVLAGLASALTLGILFSYWCLSLTLPQQVYDGDEYYLPPSRLQRIFFSCMSIVIAVAVALAPIRTHRDADGRKAAFVDGVARELLACADQALCLVTDGRADMNVLIHARLQRRQLTVLPADGDDAPAPSARGSKRPQPPKKETPFHFVERWLTSNPQACGQVAVASAPTLWSKAGLCPVPRGLLYLGTQDAKHIDAPRLFAEHKPLWQRLSVLLASESSRPPALESLAGDFRRQASRLANDLGVRLEEQGHPAEALQAYTQATELDANNLCATFNRYGLALQDPTAQQAVLAACEEQIQRAAKRTQHGFLFAQCAAQYGVLRQQPQSVLDRLHATATAPLVVKWIAFNHSQQAGAGAPSQPDELVAAEAPSENTLAQIVQSMRAGQTADIEARLRAFLRDHPESLSGWSILADVLMRDKRLAEVATSVLPAMQAAAGENGHELIDMLEGLLALSQTPPRPADARTFFLRALARRPKLKEAQDYLLKADLRLGNIAAVEDDVGVVLRSDPSHCEANALLGSIRLSQKRYADATKALRKSIATLPTAEALNDLSEALRIDQQFDEAEKAARHALRIAPNFYQAWDTLGCILTDQNRLKEADASFRCSLALCPKAPRVLLHLARLNVRLEKKGEAMQIMKEISPLVKNADEAFSQDYVVLSKELGSDSTVP